MPGWHEATRELQERGDLQLVGIIQEQHPARCRLFMQWKKMDWPVMVDSLNLLNVSVVPITLLIDERGIVRRRVPPRVAPRQALAEFLQAEEAAVDSRRRNTLPDLERLGKAARRGGAADWAEYGRALALWGGGGRLDAAVEAYRRAVALEPSAGRAHFRLGVVQRMLYDSESGAAADFDQAVEHWTRALRIDPNNYIWRRRIQQYGPRLHKPYPFYDWVEQARREIADRGETPLPLVIEPQGSELARPARRFDSAVPTAGPPDPEGRIRRDPGKMVRVQAVTVPTTMRPGGSMRVHLEIRPDPEGRVHWNNEAAGLVVWVDPPAGWQVDRYRIELPNPAEPASLESRRVEFEVKSPDDASSVELSSYALHYVCQGPKGACLYRRQDIPLKVEIEPR